MSSPYLDKPPVYRYTVRSTKGKAITRYRSLAAARHSIRRMPSLTIWDEYNDQPA